MTSVLGLSRFARIGGNFLQAAFFITGNSNVGAEQRRTIVNKALLRLPEDYLEPWDYRSKGYDMIAMTYDRTKPRMHQNSKLIIVEGNIGSETSRVGSEIAEILGFHFMPAFKMGDILIDRYGNDLRDYYHFFPKRFRIPDIKQFYANPGDDLTAVMQDRIFACRHEQYMNALAHIFNTGQGVVLERSVYSDFVFVNAMRSKNFIGPEYFNYYYYVRRMGIPPLRLHPHLMIYLDTPIDKCLDRIKERGDSNEIGVVGHDYLDVIRRSYLDLMKDLKRHTHILQVDCGKEVPDADFIVQDIENIEFDFFEWHSTELLETWCMLQDEIHQARFRVYITQKVEPRLKSLPDVRLHEVGELYVYPEDAAHFYNVVSNKILGTDKGYGYTDKDPYQGMDIWKVQQMMPEKWTEYYFREAYLTSMHSFMLLMDPTAQNYNPEYLKHHH